MTPKKAKILIIIISIITLALISILLMFYLLFNEENNTNNININKPIDKTNCVEDWQCSEWNKCVESIQTRTCFDLNKCGTLVDRPEIKQECTMPEPETIEDEIIEANLEKEFKLGIGEIAFIESENIKITFLNVMEDSRCPADVKCFWRGVATIQLNIIKNDQNLGVYVISDYNFNNWKNELKIDNYKITLVDINPTPVADQKLEEIDYIVTLTISKTESGNIENSTDKIEDIVPN